MTTTSDRFERVAAPLRSHRVTPVSLPCIRVESDQAVAESARAAAAAAEWLLVTSPRAIEVTWPGGMPPVPVAAVGPATASAAASAGGRVELVGEQGSASLVDDLARLVSGAEVVFPHAEGAGGETVERLTAAGARVRAYAVYRTVPIPPGDDDVDAVLFASPSAVAGWLLGRSLHGLVVAAIGPTTARALDEAGHPPQVIPSRPDFTLAAEAIGRFAWERTKT